MAVVVMKFGGTSVANVERIRNVARHVKREVDAGNEVAVVVSAMAGVTNQLVAWVREASILHDAREYDAVVATGEQVTAGLLAIVLQSMGLQARSWQGWQIPVTTDGRARRRPASPAIDGSEIKRRFAAGRGRRHHRLPGHRARAQPHRNIGPRRLRYERGRHGHRTQGRCVRHLHRRRRRLHHRPAHRAEGAAAAEGLLRGDAGDGLARLQGAADPLGRARHGQPHAGARAVELRGARCDGARAARPPGRYRHHRLR